MKEAMTAAEDDTGDSQRSRSNVSQKSQIKYKTKEQQHQLREKLVAAPAEANYGNGNNSITECRRRRYGQWRC